MPVEMRGLPFGINERGYRRECRRGRRDYEHDTIISGPGKKMTQRVKTKTSRLPLVLQNTFCATLLLMRVCSEQGRRYVPDEVRVFRGC